MFFWKQFEIPPLPCYANGYYYYDKTIQYYHSIRVSYPKTKTIIGFSFPSKLFKFTVCLIFCVAYFISFKKQFLVHHKAYCDVTIYE